MKKMILSICLMSCFSLSVQAKSDCANGEANCWDCGKTENDLCTARKTGSTLTITGTGEMRDYEATWEPRTTNRPWGYNFTSVSVQGVKNIGVAAFAHSQTETLNIGDSVQTIGRSTCSACPLQSLNIPDSVTSIEAMAFFNIRENGGNISGFFVPESVISMETVLHNWGGSSMKGPFEGNGGQTVPLYCAETSPCATSNGLQNGNLKIYTKDENGVYQIDGSYYASPDDILSKTSCGSGQTAPQNCIDAAKIYQEQKANQMAGGALCKTKADCLKLIDMSNKKEVCSSIADCKAYGRENGLGFGYDFWLTNPDGSRTHYDGDNHILGFRNKRIYTVEEATAVVSPKGNTFSIKYR